MWIRFSKGDEKIMAAKICNEKPIGMKTEIELITPEYAALVLETKNILNRSITPARVDEYAFSMLNGHYLCSHQGVAFDIDDILTDGQHRLAAVAKAGVSVWMSVTRNEPKECRSVIDEMKVRSASATSKICGGGFSEAQFATAKILKYGVVASSQAHHGNVECEQLMDTFSKGLTIAKEIGAIGGKKMHAAISAVIARAAYSQDKKALARFCEVYRTQTAEKPSENAAVKLRTYVESRRPLSEESGGVKVNFKLELYQTTEYALWKFLQGKKVTKLEKLLVEQFPMPLTLGGWK
jgi:hypothetical protein